MLNMIKKEFTLAIHPTAYIFLFLSSMLLIPNYPYYVTFFYVSLAIFFTCLNGRENNDVFYSMSLPVPKRNIVKSRFILVLILQITQLILSIPFALIRQSMDLSGNAVGIDANIAFFGSSLVMMGIFNIVFMSIYYKNVNRVGPAFVVSSIVMFVYMGIAETLVHIIPFARDYLDTKDSMYLEYKLIVLGVGIIIYVLLTLTAYFKAVKNFQKFDL